MVSILLKKEWQWGLPTNFCFYFLYVDDDEWCGVRTNQQRHFIYCNWLLKHQLFKRIRGRDYSK